MFVKRKILPLLKTYLSAPEALVLTGFRRVGKSTLVKHIFDDLETDNKVFLDMESPVSQKIFQEENYDAIATRLSKLGITMKGRVPYVFMDEIQYVREIPSIVKYLFDHYRIKFVLTGSSSFYLKHHFTESLAGRKFLFELMPLDFEEFLWFKGEKLSLDADYDLLRHLYDEFMQFGGLPGVVLEPDAVGKQLRLDDALGSYFQLDVVNLSYFRNIKVLKSLLFLLAPRVGTRLDITKLSENLGVSRQTLYNYLEFFEQTYLIHLVPAYSHSHDVITRKVPKLYFVDSGIFGRVGTASEGQLFEQTGFRQLLTTSYFHHPGETLPPRVNYFQKKSGAEIDFIVGDKGYEVKLAGSKSDVARLARFTKHLNLSAYVVISLEKTRHDGGDMVYPFSL